MIPRPVYKLLACFLGIPLLFGGSLFLWSISGNPLKTYYLGSESGFLFESLLPLPGPLQKLNNSLGLSTPETAQDFDVITMRCGNKGCYATPQDIAAKIRHRHTKIHTRPSKLYAILNKSVFAGHPFRWLKVDLVIAGLLWIALFIWAAIRDHRRREQLMGDGVRIAGRRAVSAASFGGLRARWFPKKHVNIAVMEPSQEDVPLSYD